MLVQVGEQVGVSVNDTVGVMLLVRVGVIENVVLKELDIE